MKDNNKPPTEQPSNPTAPSTASSQTDSSSVPTPHTLSETGEYGIPGSVARLYAIRLALLEPPLRAAAQHTLECAENEHLATARRLEADRRASLALQQFYAVTQAFEDEVAARSGSVYPHHPPNVLFNLSSLLLEHASQALDIIQQRRNTSSTPTQSSADKSQKSGVEVEKLGKGKEKAGVLSPMSSGPSVPIMSGTSSSPSEIAPLGLQQTYQRPEVAVGLTSSTCGAERRQTEGNHPHLMDGASPRLPPAATLDGASSISTPVAGPSTQSSPAAAIGLDNEFDDAFAAFTQDEINEINNLVDEHMERISVCSACLPGCPCRRLYDKPFPSGPPSPM